MALEWDGFTFDLASQRLFGPDGGIHVEPQVFAVLAILIEHRDRVVTKAEILDSVWGDQFVSESALSTRIKQIRQALGDDGRTQKYVRSVHGRGYQFVGEIAAPSESAAAGRSVPVQVPEPQQLQVALDIAVDTEFPFVGRTEELEQCRVLLDKGRELNTQIYIGGAPGAGKSRLAVQLLDESVASGAFACAGRCESEATSGLQAVREAFIQLAATHPTKVAGWAQGVEGPLLSLMPSLVSYLRGDPVPVDAYAGIDVFMAVFDRVTADGPLVLLIDDLQWSDDPTRTLLGRLHRRLRGRAFSTVATYRSGRGELPTEVHQWIQQQRRSEHVADLRLGDLDPDAARALITAVVGSDKEGADDRQENSYDDLLAVTAGHCLFLTESLRDVQLGQSTSDSVIELVASRLDRQSADVQQIVKVGALLGTEFPFLTASTAAGLEPEAALLAIDVAIEAELLHETASASRFRFSHQLVPQAITDSLSKAQRAAIHRACVVALTGQGAAEAEIAFHALGAIPLISSEEAVVSARVAAERAEAANQFDLAIRLLQRVVDTEPQTRTLAEVLLSIGELLNSKGTPGEAVPILDRVIEIARANSWPDLFVAAVLAHWGQSPFRKPSDRTTRTLLTEADELLGDEVSVEKARVMAKTAVFDLFLEPLASRDIATKNALEMAEQVGVDTMDRLMLLEARHIAFSCPAGIDELDVLDPQIDEIRLANNAYFTDAAAPEAAAFMRGRGEDLRRVTAGDADRLAAQPIVEWRNLVIGSTLAAFAGEVEAARDLCDRASEIGEAFWGEAAFALHGFGHLFNDLVSGDWSRSFELLELLTAFDGSAVFLPPLALAAMHAGDTAKLEETVARFRLGTWMALGEHMLGGNALVAAAELALAVDDDELASAAEAALTPHANLVLGVPWGAASLAAADPLSRLAARRGDDDTAQAHRATAEALYRSLEAPALLKRMI
ncbi:MAG: AAA family ATPase [Acidimicrobiales bacterium]